MRDSGDAADILDVLVTHCAVNTPHMCLRTAASPGGAHHEPGTHLSSPGRKLIGVLPMGGSLIHHLKPVVLGEIHTRPRLTTQTGGRERRGMS